MNLNNLHTSVLPQETLELLDVKTNHWYLDATLGDAGHTLLLLQKGARVIAIDQDTDALKRSQARLQQTSKKILIQPDGFDSTADCLLFRSNFSALNQLSKTHHFPPLAGILFDLGVSTHQILSDQRGFSFTHDAPLDMRMDQSLAVTAADLLNFLSLSELERILKELGGEKNSKSIAKAIKQSQRFAPITTTKQLADIISSVKPGHGRIHPATKTFQALRMVVNQERDALRQALPQAVDLLAPQGRLVVISFHSGEDQIVKDFLKNNSALTVLTKKPVTPSQLEIKNNPRARSAKLRAALKN